MKKISFEELCDLVAHVDYLWENTFPIYFNVDSTEYVAGIGYYDCGDDTGDPFGVFGITEELQYLARLEPKIDKEDNTISFLVSFLDVDDPDDMTYDDIVEMLKKQCNITEKSKIEISNKYCFDGTQKYIKWSYFTDDAKNKALKKYEERSLECK